MTYNSQFLVISAEATSVFLSDKIKYPFFFRTIPNDAYIATAICKLLSLFNWTLISVLYADDDIGISGASCFPQAANNQGIFISCTSIVTTESLDGLDSFFSCFINSSSSILVLWMGPQDASLVIKRMSSISGMRSLVYIAPPQWANFNNFTTFSEDGFNASSLKGK